MAQTSRLSDNGVWPAIVKALDILGDSKEPVIYHLHKMRIDLSSIEDVEQGLTSLLGEGAQIVMKQMRK